MKHELRGDTGQSDLIDTHNVPKFDLRFELLGTLGEVSPHWGWCEPVGYHQKLAADFWFDIRQTLPYNYLLVDHLIRKIKVLPGVNVPKVGMQPIRRKQILDAAFKSVAERSLESTRMRYIAEVAGISQPSLHYYFDTKDKLIIALLDRLLAEFREGREERLVAAGEPLAKLRVLLEQQKQIIAEKSDNLEVYYDFWVQATKRPSVRKKVQQMYANWRTEIRQILDEGVSQGIFREDRTPLAPAMLISIFQGAALQSIIDSKSFDLDQYFEQADQYLASFLGYEGS